MIAAATSSDIGLLFVLLALVAFGVAVYFAWRREVVPAIGAAFVGILILIFS